MPQYDVDLRDYWRIIKKRKIIIFLMIVLVGICSYGFAKLKEPVPLYQTSSAIKIEQSTNLASLFSGGFWYPTNNMVTHAYIISSFPVLVKTARALGWVPEDQTIDEIRMSNAAMTALERLKSMVTAEQEEGTNIINILAVSKDPEEAALVANALADAYRKYDVEEKNRKTIETKKFIEEQLGMTSRSLKRAEEDLQAFKEGYGLISIDEQTKNNLIRLYSVQADYEAVQENRKDVAHKLEILKRIDPKSPEDFERMMFSVPVDSPIYELRKKLSDLFLQRQTLLIHLTEKHPEVTEIDDEIQAVSDELGAELNAVSRTLQTQEAALLNRLRQLRQENQSLPEKAIALVDRPEVTLQEALYSQLKAKYQETLIQESGKLEEVTIVRPAVIHGKPFNIPSKYMIIATGMVMGLIIGIVLAFGAEVFDTSMGTIEDVEESLKVPVLGVIPFLGKDDKIREEVKLTSQERARDLIMHYDPKSLAAEAFRSLRTNLQFMGLETKGKSFLITSSFVREGKTLNSINLALSVAQTGERVLLVEADLRKPVIYQNFGLNKEPGLTDFVLGNYHWREVVNNISDVMLGDFEMDDILKTPGLDNLHIINSGTRPPNPSEILSSERFRQFVTEVSGEYDYVFIDAPPILPVADASEIAPVVDGVVLVYTVGKIGRGVLKRAKATLDNVDAKVLGVILNNVKPEVGPDYFRYHTQHYYGSEFEEEFKPGEGSLLKRFIQKLKNTADRQRIIGILAIIFAIGLMLFGIFWKELF